MHLTPIRRLALLVLVIALALAACSGSGESSDTSSTTTTTTTTTTLPPDAPIDADLAATIQSEVATLIRETEELRGLEFLTEPEVTVLNTADLADRVEALLLEDLDPAEIEIADRLYTLLGMLDESDDLSEVYLDVYAEQVLGFYDGETGELVVGAKADGLSAYDKTVVIHELVHALTDQHFRFHPTFEELIDAERHEEAAALQALIEGDATYFQLVYLQELPVADQFSIAVEALDVDTSAIDAAPSFIEADLLFAYDDGYRFVLDLVGDGGIAAVDTAYLDPPRTTEQILHPELYATAEVGLPVVLPDTSLPGYETHEEGVFGEWGLHLLFLDTIPAGDVTQAGTGWGGDAYRVLTSGDDVAFVLKYRGETERDAIELTEALIEHVREAMEVGDGVGDGSGLLFEGSAGYVFIDREGDRLTFIAATDPQAGSRLRSALS